MFLNRSLVVSLALGWASIPAYADTINTLGVTSQFEFRCLGQNIECGQVFGETFASPSINTYLDSFTFAVESVQGGGSLLALVLAPERVNAWVNLGQAYAKQGQRSVAVACLANGYRFSENQAATRQFLHKLAEDGDEDEEVRKAARQTLQLPVVQADKD